VKPDSSGNPADCRATFERLLLERAGDHYSLTLYVTGMSQRSTDAVALVKSLCEEILAGHYDLDVIDIYRDPAAARDSQIVAAPTLVRTQPLPVRRLVGNLSDRARVLMGLELAPS
jgi:circadian clock protein KaiB